MLNKIIILIIHIMVALVLGYLSFSIVMGKQIPKLVGILLGLSAVLLVVTAHIYFFSEKRSKDGYCGGDSVDRRLRDAREDRRHRMSLSQSLRQRGLSYDKNDPNYAPIGGRPGGVTWV